MGRKTGAPKGQPRKNAAEKAKTGSLNTTREKAYAKQEMKALPLPEYPAAPPDLNDDGKWLWDMAAKELKDLKVLSLLDLANLRAMCIEWQCYLKHRRQQMDDSIGSYYKIEGKAGTVYQPHPVHYNATNHLREFTRIANDFGLSPAARARMGVAAQDTSTSKAASLLKKAV